MSGRVWAAESLVLEAMRALHASDAAKETPRFLPLLLQCAFAEGTATSLDLVLYYCGRARTQSPELLQVEALARAAQLVNQGDGARALSLLTSPSDDPVLERARHSARVVAASEQPIETHERVVAEAAAWAGAQADPTLRALAVEWRGWLLYHQERYEEAIRVHEEASAMTNEAHRRIAALLGAAWAALESADLHRCRSLATEARTLAEEFRHVHYEARAEALLRAAAYRSGDHGPPDLELVQALSMLSSPRIHAVALLTEAAAAWRLGQQELARRLAHECSLAFRSAGEVRGVALGRALALLCGADDDPAAIERLIAEPKAPQLALQTIALLARARHTPTAESLSIARRIGTSLSARAARARREVLSPEEAMGFIGDVS
jgi:tetratricopeptide (TPR) repeat protein